MLTEGRIVHYIAYNGRQLAALVTGHTEDNRCDLAVFTNMANVNGVKSGGLQFHFDVPYAAEPTPGCWRWPERA